MKKKVSPTVVVVVIIVVLVVIFAVWQTLLPKPQVTHSKSKMPPAKVVAPPGVTPTPPAAKEITPAPTPEAGPDAEKAKGVIPPVGGRETTTEEAVPEHTH